jgi:S1-C subfamily serine protease
VISAADTADQRIEFTTWKSGLSYGDIVGSMDYGLFCSDDRKLTYSKDIDNWLSHSLGRVYRERAEKLGIVRPAEEKSVFDKGSDGPGFQLGATLLALDYRVCGGGEQVKGDGYAKIKWELFSTRRQKVVYSAVVEGSHHSDSRVDDKQFDNDFMTAIVDNLLADPKLAAVVRSGGMVDEAPAKQSMPLAIAVGSTISGGVAKSANAMLSAVATIESGSASGSGFFISHDGYLLTNQHVVGDAAFVRVRLADGRNMVGEVLRRDADRDVALLRTDPVTIDVLPVRADPAKVGEEVYALGSPYGTVLSGTLTRGILSARRILEGSAYLQSDVAINPGNSGGPLVDADGRVLGLARLGSHGQGLNMFVPIDEAIARLNLALTAGPQPAVAKAQ